MENVLPFRYGQRLIESILALPRLRDASPQIFQSQPQVFLSALHHFQIDLKIHGTENLATVDPHRGVIVIANHPRGLLDGVCLAHLVENVWGRSDFKFIANSIIRKVLPVLEPYCLPVENMGLSSYEETVIKNGISMSQAVQLLRQNGVVILNPAGQVSEWKFRSREGWFRVTDTEWSSSVVDLVRRSKATVVPVHIGGSNSFFFQLLSFFGANFKRLWLFREFLNSSKKKVTLTIGRPITESCNFRRAVYALENL